MEEQLKEVRKKCAEEAQLVKTGWLLLRIYASAAFPGLKWKRSPFLVVVVRWQSNQHSGHMKEMNHGSSRNYRPSLGKVGYLMSYFLNFIWNYDTCAFIAPLFVL